MHTIDPADTVERIAIAEDYARPTSSGTSTTSSCRGSCSGRRAW